jgi:hypothetical protein
LVDTTPLNKLSLVDLHRCLLNGSRPAASVRDHIRHRSKLATALFRLWAVEQSESDLMEFQDRLHAAATPDPRLDPAQDAAEQEIADVQLSVIEEELGRRERVAEQLEQDADAFVTRNDLVGYLFEVARYLRDHRPPARTGDDTAPPWGSLMTIVLVDLLVHEVERALMTNPPGRLVVADALRAVDQLEPRDADPADAWVRSAVVFELLTQEGGWMGVTLPVDPVTRSQAVRAKRIFYGEGRQDPRDDDLHWPLDLSGPDIADVLGASEHASAAWSREQLPDVDLDSYLEPLGREESGRPTPHPSVIPEAEARELVLAQGTITSPMVLFVPPSERVARAGQIWKNGPPDIEPRALGVQVYSLGGDPRVRWGAVTFPHGFLCVVDLPPAAILNLGRSDSARDEAAFEQMAAQATRDAPTEADYADRLRAILLERGVKAVARYDHVAKELNKPQELILLEPATALKFIREAIPSFMRGSRPVYVLPRGK